MSLDEWAHVTKGNPFLERWSLPEGVAAENCAFPTNQHRPSGTAHAQACASGYDGSMSNTTPPTVPLIDDATATGNVRDVFDDIKRTKNIDFVPAFWRVLANNPDQLEQVWHRLKFLMH